MVRAAALHDARTLVGPDLSNRAATDLELFSGIGYSAAHARRSAQAAWERTEPPATPPDATAAKWSPHQDGKKAQLSTQGPGNEAASALAAAACGPDALFACSHQLNCRGCAVMRVIRYLGSGSLECLTCQLAEVVELLQGGDGKPGAELRAERLESALCRLWQVRRCMPCAAAPPASY